MRNALGGILLLIAGSAQAATVTQCGPNICYEYDNAQSAVAQFGQPSFAGDAVRFLPPSFRAQSDDGAGLVDTSASFTFSRVYTVSGMEVDSIMITEFGDYEITNGDRVSNELTLDVTNNNNSLESGSDVQLFTANNDSAGIRTWQVDGAFNVYQEFQTNDVGLTITNVLEAETNAFGESAWIQKKLTITASSMVPVPAAGWFMMSALGALGWMRRRRGR